MANYKGHIAGAMIVFFIGLIGVILLPLAWLSSVQDALGNWQLVSVLFVVTILFGLWPDIDTNSKAQDIFFAFAFLINALMIILGHFEISAYLGLMAMTPIIGKHRGWTHNKISMLVVPLPILLVSFLYQQEAVFVGGLFYCSAVSGYFSHLLLDGLITKHFRVKGD